MTLAYYLVTLTAIAGGSAMMYFAARMRMMRAAAHGSERSIEAGRYRPMLRLLSEADAEFAGTGAVGKLYGTRRRRIARGYLRCLCKDYGFVLAGLRQVLVQSLVDRPELAKALLQNELLFAWHVCRIDFAIRANALGIGSLDARKLGLQALVEAMEGLHTQSAQMARLAVAA